MYTSVMLLRVEYIGFQPVISRSHAFNETLFR